MPEIERKLNEMGYELPPPRTTLAGNFVPAVRTGNLVYLSGHGPSLPEGGFSHVGKVGQDLSVEDGYAAARQTMLNLLTSLKGEIGDLDKLKRVIKLLCMVNASLDFKDSPGVANGASDLLVSLYGDKGRHARSAVGMGMLPGQMAVEIEMIGEVED